MRARKHRLTSVDNARLRLNALVLQHPCEPYGQLLNRIGRHYIYQASQALLRVAGDLDLLGSPVAVPRAGMTSHPGREDVAPVKPTTHTPRAHCRGHRCWATWALACGTSSTSPPPR